MFLKPSKHAKNNKLKSHQSKFSLMDHDKEISKVNLYLWRKMDCIGKKGYFKDGDKKEGYSISFDSKSSKNRSISSL